MKPKAKGVTAAQKAERARLEAEILEYVAAHQPCRMMSIHAHIKPRDVDRTKKLLQHMRDAGLLARHGRTRGRSVWCLPEFDSDVALAASERLWAETGALRCATAGPPVLRHRSQEDNDDDDERAYAFRHVIVPADRCRVTIPANAVRSVFDLGLRCAA